MKPKPKEDKEKIIEKEDLSLLNSGLSDFGINDDQKNIISNKNEKNRIDQKFKIEKNLNDRNEVEKNKNFEK